MLLLLLLNSSILWSQNYKYGKVSKEELAETENAQYPDANATVLFREYKAYFEYRQGEGFTLYTEVFERIKIYNNEGYDWATEQAITYNHGSSREEFSVKGTTYNLVNGSIEKVKLRNDGIFEERISNYRIRNKFTMPNISPGSVIEYQYTIISPFTSIEDIDLQYTIPIKKQVVELKIPEFYVYNTHSNPQASLAFKFQSTSKEKQLNLRGRSGLGTADYNTDRAQTQDRSVTYKNMIYTLDESNIPPLKTEAYVDNLANYQARSIWELAMINNPGSIPKTFSTSWEAVSKSIYENDDFVNEINKTDYFKSDVEAVTSSLSDPLEKVAAIFSLVKSKVKWNEYVGFYPEKGVKKAYKSGVGNVADINLMLVSMLRYVNINAHPILLSTKSNGVPVYPTRNGFNYVIAGVEYNGKIYIMDASDPLSNINLLPERAMNWQGRLIRPDGSSDWVGLYPNQMSQKLTYAQAEILDGEVQVMVRERLGGHFAKSYRDTFAGSTNDAQSKELAAKFEDVAVSEFEPKDVETLKANLSMSYKAQSSSVIEEIDGDLYLSPLLFFAQKENPFKADSRVYPIFFEYPRSKKFNISIKIPEGYKVASIPQGVKLNLANETGSYTYLLKESNGMLQLAVTLDIKTPIILSQDYEYVKGMFSQMVEKEKEKIVLTKL